MKQSGNILLPTAYFPPVSYFIHLIRSKAVCIEQMETYPKQTYRNRCEIMSSSGKAMLIVPVSKPDGNHTLTKDIEISYQEPWQQHQWKTLQAAYRSSPFFSFYADIIQPLFEYREKQLLQLNNKILETITSLIGIQPSISFTQDFEKQPDGLLDLRSVISPKKQQSSFEFMEYPQVFAHRHGFLADLSILDLLFNLGPEAREYIERGGK